MRAKAHAAHTTHTRPAADEVEPGAQAVTQDVSDHAGARAHTLLAHRSVRVECVREGVIGPRGSMPDHACDPVVQSGRVWHYLLRPDLADDVAGWTVQEDRTLPTRAR